MHRFKCHTPLAGLGRNLPLALCLVIGGLLVVQFGFAVRLLSDSFPNLSTYADSPHYLNLARGKTIPEVRGVLYPLFLRLLARLSDRNLHTIAYFVQLVLTGFASLYFCFAILGTGLRDRLEPHPFWFWLLFLLPITMLIDPLSLHFDLSIMPDSLAASMALIFIGSLVLLWSGGAVRYRAIHILLCLTSFIAISLLRREKLVVGGLVLAILLVFSLIMFLRRRDRELRRRLITILICILLIGGSAAAIIDRAVPRRGSGDESITNVRLLLVNRFAWEVFDRIYDHLSEETRESITPTVARDIQLKRRNLNLFMIPVLRKDPEKGTRILDDMIRTSMTREGSTVVRYVVEDVCLYLSAPLGFYYQLVFKPERRQYTAWTLSNMKWQAGMEARRRTYIDRYLRMSGGLLACILAAACLGRIWARRGGQVLPPSADALVIILLFHLVNTSMFALLSPKFHIRYALPSCKLLALICYTLLFAYIFTVRMRGKEPTGAYPEASSSGHDLPV